MKVSLNHTLLLAALSTSFYWHSTAAQIEGKLFTSSEERVYLDYLRDEFLARTQTAGFNIVEADIPDIPTVTTAEQVPIEYTLGGIMTSRDGTRTVWLNGRSIAESALPKGLSIREQAGNLVLRLTTPSGNHVLRPGQTVEIYSGLIQEQYQRPRPALQQENANNPEQVVALVPEDDSPVSETTETDAPPTLLNPEGTTTEATPAEAATIAAADSLPGELLNSRLPGTNGPQASAAPTAPQEEPAPDADREAFNAILKTLNPATGAFDAAPSP